MTDEEIFEDMIKRHADALIVDTEPIIIFTGTPTTEPFTRLMEMFKSGLKNKTDLPLTISHEITITNLNEPIPGQLF